MMRLELRPKTLLPLALAAVIGFAAVPSARTAGVIPVGQEASVEVGQPAPDFTLPDETGKPHHLADYRGRTVILAFYPKDFTAG
jgi:cytochrome oxidase Cu insertion factor (SCO1/SenC/PrrC family)